MTQYAHARLLALGLLLATAGSAHAQTPATAPSTEPASVTPLRIQVVIARYKGDRLVSSLPYTLSVNAPNTGRAVAQMRMGADIPVASGPSTLGEGKTSATVNYDQIGTQIDCIVRPAAGGRYAVELSVSDKTVYAEGEGPSLSSPSRTPTFRAFRASNSVLLRDGQSTQFAAATDRMTGEVVRVEALLQVVK